MIQIAAAWSSEPVHLTRFILDLPSASDFILAGMARQVVGLGAEGATINKWGSCNA